MAYDNNQTFVAETFIDLYCDRQRRLTIGKDELARRYDLCEDLGTMLVDHCRNVHFRDGVDEDTVLTRCFQGLGVEPTQVTRAEARWVVCRTAELLEWTWQSLPTADG